MVVVRLRGKRMGSLLKGRPSADDRQAAVTAVGRVPAAGARSRPADRLLVTRQGHEREVEAIQVILEVEDLREAGAGELVLAPVALGPLRVQQVVGAGPRRVAPPLAG